MAKRMRYKQIDQLLTRVLIADTAIFVLYLIFAAIGLSVMKVIIAIIALLLSGLSLAYLYRIGETYRAAGDGSVELVSDEETIPFSVVTYLDPDETRNLKEIRSYEELCEALDGIVAERGKNRFYMVRIDGNFNEINVRSVNAQDEPYEPLVDVLEHDQTFFDYENIEGTMIGLYCPPYMADLNAVGWHLH